MKPFYIKPRNDGTRRDESENDDHEMLDLEAVDLEAVSDEPEIVEMEDDSTDDEPQQKYVFFDFETLRRLPEQGGTKYNLEVNLAVVHVACDLCKDQTELDEHSFCDNCGYKEKVFGGDDSLDDFCSWLFNDNFQGAICIAHNLRSFDAYPILNYLYRQAIVPSIILTGAKIMCMQVKCLEIRFIDSLNFVPSSLAKFPGIFGLSAELGKSYFPHFLNEDEYQNYVGPLPPKEFYGFDDMRSLKDQNEFMSWYNDLLSRNYVLIFNESL